jgi:hypothetical protein
MVVVNAAKEDFVRKAADCLLGKLPPPEDNKIIL